MNPALQGKMAGDTDKRAQEQSQAPAPPHPPDKSGMAGDTIAVNVGEGAAHVAAGKNIIQIGSLTLPRWAALLIVLALAAVAAARPAGGESDAAEGPAIVQGLAAAYFRLGWLQQQPAADLSQAIADYSKAIELNPQFAFACNNRGLAYRDQGDLAQAIADFNRAIELDPQFALAYFNRGVAWYTQGDLAPALADYSKTVELDPQNADANNALCWTLALLQRAGAAMPYCEAAVALADNPSYRDSRGLAYALLGDYAAAAADFQVFADWLAENVPDATELIAQRVGWIEALGRGENPFTADMLEELKQQ